MRRWRRPRSLQLRLSLLFVGLLVAVSGVYLLLLSRSADDYLAEDMQRRNLDLSASVAKVLSIDSATNEIPPAAIAETFRAAMIINPNIKLYLIGLDGHLIAASAKPNEIQAQAVDMSPVRAMLTGGQPLPVYGTDPRHPAPAAAFFGGAAAQRRRCRALLPLHHPRRTGGYFLRAGRAAPQPHAGRAAAHAAGGRRGRAGGGPAADFPTYPRLAAAGGHRAPPAGRRLRGAGGRHQPRQ